MSAELSNYMNMNVMGMCACKACGATVLATSMVLVLWMPWGGCAGGAGLKHLAVPVLRWSERRDESQWGL